MKIRFKDYLEKNIMHEGFKLSPRDAFDSAKNIEAIFIKNARWFIGFKPLHYTEIRSQYKKLLPLMEINHPGVVDKIVQPEIIRQLGFIVHDNGMVEYPR